MLFKLEQLQLVWLTLIVHTHTHSLSLYYIAANISCQIFMMIIFYWIRTLFFAHQLFNWPIDSWVAGNVDKILQRLDLSISCLRYLTFLLLQNIDFIVVKVCLSLPVVAFVVGLPSLNTEQQMALWHFNTTLLLTGLTINDALVQFRLVCCLFTLVAWLLDNNNNCCTVCIGTTTCQQPADCCRRYTSNSWLRQALAT